MNRVVVIAGGSGLIGQALSERLAVLGYEVRILSRKARTHPTYKYFQWDTANKSIDMDALKDAGIVVNLAGAGIVDKRWTKSRKDTLINSRVQSTELLVQSIEVVHPEHRPVLINASAIGYYGDSGSDWMTEDRDPETNDFLSKVTRLWEESAQKARGIAPRVVIFRIGLVLTNNGGALPQMKKSLQFRIGGYFGDGRQYYSYIHIKDLINMFIYAMGDDLDGVYNAVGNNPVTNKEFIEAMADAMNISAIPLSVPEFVLKLGMGEMASTILNSNRVSNRKIRESGFSFEFEDVNDALEDLLG